MNTVRAVASGGLGARVGGFPQFLAEQLTLSQPGGQIMPTTVLYEFTVTGLFFNEFDASRDTRRDH